MEAGYLDEPEAGYSDKRRPDIQTNGGRIFRQTAAGYSDDLRPDIQMNGARHSDEWRPNIRTNGGWRFG